MAEPVDNPSRMERLGLRFFQRLSLRYPTNFSPDDIHVLNPQERGALRALQRWAVIRAALAGGISAAIGVVVGLLLEPMLEGQVEDPPFELWWPYFSLVTGISILVTIFEIAFLYWDALRTVHRISTVAGLDLFPTKDNSDAVALALVRAALELPNPPDDVEGVNPRREVSKLRLLIGTTVYKLKATATNFLLKAVVRRIVGRSGFRALIEFVAVPVYAAWNALICWWVLRQARIRAMGPSAAKEFTAFIIKENGEVAESTRALMMQAVGASIVRTVDVHPNMVAILEVLEKSLGNPGEIVLDDSRLFLDGLGKEAQPAQEAILRVLVLACILDGSLGTREKQLLSDAYQICHRQVDLGKAKRLLKAFVRGDDIDKDSIINCIPGRIHFS